MIGLGVAYIAIGIYGYGYAVQSGKTLFHLLYFLIQMLLGGAIVHLGEGVGYNAMVLLPLAGHSVVLLPRDLRLMVNIALVVTYAMALNPFSTGWGVVWSGLPLFMAGQIFIVVFTQMAVSEERARAEVEQLVKELEEANNQLRTYAIQVEELATTKERNRLAREIHDGLGHYLTTIHMQIQAARAVMTRDPDKAMDALATAQSQAQEALIDVRRSVSALRDLPGDSIRLDDEIEKMLKSCEGAGISSEIKILGTPRTLSPQSLTTIFRTVQEGINNSVKHAHPNHISVTLDYTQSQQVRLLIQDDGVGAEKLDGGFGLVGIRERVRLLNGRVNIVTQPGNGFCLEVFVPG